MNEHGLLDHTDNGRRVEVRIGGDDSAYIGTVIKGRKLWVELDDALGIEDENSIGAWRFVGETAWRTEGCSHPLAELDTKARRP